MDPLADKILLVASFWVLTSLGVFPVWLTILVVSRDALIVAGALYLKQFEEKPAIPPSLFGKMTTGSQLAAIFWVLLFYFLNSRAPFLDGISVVTAVLTFISGSQYLLGFMRRVGDSS